MANPAATPPSTFDGSTAGQEDTSALNVINSEVKADLAAEKPSAVQQATAQLKEEQIPIFADEKKKPELVTRNPLQKFAMGSVIVLLLLSGLTLALKKWLSKKAKQGSTPSIKVLSQHFLGPRKSLAIIRVAGESVLIGVTDHNISLIKTLSMLDEDLPSDIVGAQGFSDSIHQAEIVEDHKEIRAGHTEPIEGFSIKTIRDVVSQRLKGMKDLR